MDDLRRTVTRGHAELLVNNADALLRYSTYNKEFRVLVSPIRWAVAKPNGEELLALRAEPTADGVNIAPLVFVAGEWEEYFIRWAHAALADDAIWRYRRALIDEASLVLAQDAIDAALLGRDPQDENEPQDEDDEDHRSDEEILQDELDFHAAQRADLP